jgi:hypothetical protein
MCPLSPPSVDRLHLRWSSESRPAARARADMGGMALSNPVLGVVLTTLAIAAPAARVLNPLIREVRICLLLWLALRRTSPDQRASIIRALPSLDEGSPSTRRSSKNSSAFDFAVATESAIFVVPPSTRQEPAHGRATYRRLPSRPLATGQSPDPNSFRQGVASAKRAQAQADPLCRSKVPLLR